MILCAVDLRLVLPGLLRHNIDRCGAECSVKGSQALRHRIRDRFSPVETS
jgi:hypothetical protein